LELAKFDHVEQGKHVEVWAAKTFYEFQKFKGFPLTKSIRELLEESNLRPFVNMFIMFMLEVTRRDDGLYPPTTIQSLVRAFDCLIRTHEKLTHFKNKLCTIKTFQYPY
jgi:hypothetical protein